MQNLDRNYLKGSTVTSLIFAFDTPGLWHDTKTFWSFR